MSLFRDLFSRSQPGAEKQHQVVNWPPPPLIKPVPAGRSGMAVFPDLSAGAQLMPDKYGPAIIIGLGKAGEIVLRQWLEELAQDPAGPQRGLHFLLITHSLPELLPENIVKTRILQLDTSKTLPFTVRAPLPASLRSDSCLRFRQAANYRQFTSWLGDCLLSHRSEIRVFVVGSLAEREIGVMGDILQILRIMPESPGKSSVYANITALLSLDPVGIERIPPQDVFTALREIGRFTYNGPHIFDNDFNLHSIRWDAALLDHLFLLENRVGSSVGFFEGTPFDRGLGQAFAEFLFTMTHPASRSFWQDLADELYQDAGHLHHNTHRIFVNTFGAATLYVPVSEIQIYIASRLSLAAIYGERPDIPEGLLARKASLVDNQANAKLLGQRWLLTGPCKHNLFEWLLNANSPGYFRLLPALAPELDAVFQAQLSHGLVGFLNDPAGSDLETARLALEYLQSRLDQIDQWFKSAPAQNPDNLDRLTLQGFLDNWQKTIKHLIDSINAWLLTLVRPAEDNQGPVFPSTNWRIQTPSSDVNDSDLEQENKIGVWALLQETRKAAEKDLQARARDQIYRPVTADQTDDLAEAELYYVDTIRPELSRYIKESNPNFTRVRERVEWWINLVPGRLPDLLLICWPVDYSVRPGMEPPSEACFTPATATAFGKALLQVSRAQVKGRADDLVGPWFEKRLETTIEFLRRAAEAYLTFDEDIALPLPNAASRNSYLFARDLTISQKHLDNVFPFTAVKTKKPLGDGEKTRLTALTFRLNIPIEAIISCEPLLRDYHNKAYQSLHLFRQEANSTVYEKRIWEIDRERLILPPQCGISLYDQQLVTLFWQALIAGLVNIQRDQKRQNPQWTMDAIPGQFDELRLESPDLVSAFKCFVLEKPYDSKLNEKPSSPFYSQKRSGYLAQLQAVIKDRMHQPDYSERRAQFSKTIITKWQDACEQDSLEKAFLYLLKVEFDGPVWKDW
jgi:hypothetical protein